MRGGKASDKISQVSVCGEQPKINIDEEHVLLISLFGINGLMIVFLFLQPLFDINLNLSHVL